MKMMRAAREEQERARESWKEADAYTKKSGSYICILYHHPSLVCTVS